MSVFELVSELCVKVFDSEFTNKGWYPDLPKIRSKALKKLRSSCYEIFLHKVSVPDSNYEEDWSPVAQVLGHVFTLQQQGLYKDAKKMSTCGRKFLDCNLHKDPVVVAVLELLLRLQDSVPRKEDYEPVLFRYKQPKPYDPTQGPMPYEILHPSTFQPQPWMLHLARADPLDRGYLPASGGFPFSSEPGQDLPLLGRFLQPAQLDGSGSKVALYTIPKFPKLTEPRGLQIPQLTSDKPLADEGYATPSAEDSRNLSPYERSAEDLLLAADAVWQAALTYNPPALRTWESLGKRIVPKERPFLSEAGQEAAKHFIEVAKEWPQHHAGGRNVLSVSHFVSVEQLLQDLGYLLLGVQSHTFPFSEEEFAFGLSPGICLDEISPLGVSNFCREFLEMGTCARRLQLLCQRGVPGHPRTQLMEALREHVNTYLQFHWGAALLMPQGSSLLALRDWAHGLHRKTTAMARLCGVAPPSVSWQGPRQLPSGIALVSYIYESLSVETRPDVCCILYSTLQAVSRVYFRFLAQWIFKGALSDAWEEFFIQAAGCVRSMSSRDRKYWAQVFQVVRSAVPGFLRGLEDDILLCGKTVHLLKLCCPKASLCVALESGHPSVPCCLGGRELRRLSSECRQFERRVQEVQRSKSEISMQGTPSWTKRGLTDAEIQERQETIRQARERHMLRIKLEQEAGRQAEVQKQQRWRAELQQQAQDTQERREEERLKEHEEELRALEANRQLQLEDNWRKQQEKQRMIEYYEELSEMATKRKLLAEWRLERMNLRDRRKDFILSDWRATAAELNIKNLEQSHSTGALTIIEEDGDTAKSDSPIENHDPALSLPLNATTGEINTVGVEVNNTTTDQASPNNNNVDNANDRGDINENINELMILNMRRSTIDNAGPNLLDATIEDVALGNVLIPLPDQDTNATNENAASGIDNSAFTTAAAIKAKVHDEEYGLHRSSTKDDEQGKKNIANPARVLSAAEKNKQKVLEQEFGVTQKAERPKTVPFKSVRQSQSQESVRQNFQNTVAQRRTNRWNMLHGDSNIVARIQDHSSKDAVENANYQPSEMHAVSTNGRIYLSEGIHPVIGDQNSLSNHNVLDTEKAPPTEMNARSMNRFNMLQGDFNIVTGAQNPFSNHNVSDVKKSQRTEMDAMSTNRWNMLQGDFNVVTGVPNPLSSHNELENKINQNSEMDAMSTNRWNMLQGDFNIITGDRNHGSNQNELEDRKDGSPLDGSPSDGDPMSTQETPSDDGVQPVLQSPLCIEAPMSKSESSGSVNHVYTTASGQSSKTSSSYNITSITSSTSFDMGSGKFSLNTPISMDDGAETFKTCSGGSCSSDDERHNRKEIVNTSIPYWKSHRLGADEGDLGETEDLQRDHTDDELKDSSDASDAVDFTDFTSINVALQKSVAIPLYTQLHLANEAVLKYFFEDLDLFGHFLSLRSYFFMMDGEYSRTLTNSLFQKISTVRQPSNLLNYVVLNALLRKSLDASLNCGEENAKRLSFKVSSTPDHFHLTSTDVLKCLSLQYHTEWPLNVILTKESILKYNVIFTFLIKVRLVSWRLEHCFHRLKGAGGKDFGKGSKQYHSIQVWRHEMTHFVRSFQNYIMSTALQSSWEFFEREINNVQTLDNLYVVHVAYVKKILFRCLLFKNCRGLHRVLMDAFNTILKFHAQLEASQWRSSGRNNPIIEHPDFRTLANIHSSFQKFAELFYKLVDKLIHSGYQTHLSELLEMLNANEYYTSRIPG